MLIAVPNVVENKFAIARVRKFATHFAEASITSTKNAVSALRLSRTKACATKHPRAPRTLAPART